ncbi:MAG: methylenetetrahydrofolate reductase [Spirochaetaceae bacterium]|jgi:methylenetetrahydrofolate reductase (NADPH)|nr:methylenetetrahydrofolate reductase [Spirochaetaceae bacterium]
MKISERLARGMTFSFEVFPPKNDQSLEPLLETLERLKVFRPDFVSVTYGAGGTNRGRSLEICRALVLGGTDPLAHLTAIGTGREEIRAIVKEYADAGVENILALRGDFPPGWEGTRGDFAHAGALTAFLRAEFGGLCIAVAGYPEKHLEAPAFESDIAHLRAKQDAGASFITLQLCHDVDAYVRYRDRIRRAGVRLPVIAGIMPVLAREGIIKMTLANGCSIPAELAAILGAYARPDQAEDLKKAGMAYTAAQMRRFIAEGIDGIHIFTLNRWEAVSEIVALSGLRAHVMP